MKQPIILLTSLFLTVMLAACSPGINTLGNRITFDSTGIVVHTIGHPNAHVSRDGDLAIDGKAIAVTPRQRELLRHYYQQAVATIDSGEAMGKQGIDMAKQSIGAAIESAFHSGSSPAKKQVDAKSQHMEEAAGRLCADIKALGATQKTIAAQIPTFAPYASSQMQCVITRGNGRNSDAKSGAFRFTLREGNAAGAGTHATSTRRTGAASEPVPSHSGNQ
ncbi:MAG: DUF2884 family protein [Rhodanobacteraceae bacterium]